MDTKTLRTAIAEAERFVERAKAAIKEHEHARSSLSGTPYLQCGPKTSGYVRRASMDLTRVLADLRQGR